MNHKRLCHIHDVFDGAIHFLILILSFNTREALSLALSLTILAISAFYKDSIIDVVMGDF